MAVVKEWCESDFQSRVSALSVSVIVSENSEIAHKLNLVRFSSTFLVFFAGIQTFQVAHGVVIGFGLELSGNLE